MMHFMQSMSRSNARSRLKDSAAIDDQYTFTAEGVEQVGPTPDSGLDHSQRCDLVRKVTDVDWRILVGSPPQSLRIISVPIRRTKIRSYAGVEGANDFIAQLINTNRPHQGCFG